MAHIVKCRACKQSFDTDKLSPDDWVENPKRFYFKTRQSKYTQIQKK